jgi:hypothetical protein
MELSKNLDRIQKYIPIIPLIAFIYLLSFVFFYQKTYVSENALLPANADIEYYVEKSSLPHIETVELQTYKNLKYYVIESKTEGSESILFVSKNQYFSKKIINYFATRNYWAKDIMFVLPNTREDLEEFLDDYFYGISSNISRHGEIQAGICLELKDNDTFDKLYLAIEGVNGELPNLDFINTIVRVANYKYIPLGLMERAIPFQTGFFDHFLDYEEIRRLRILYSMFFNFYNGQVPNQQHSYFHQSLAKYRIDAVTILSLDSGIFSTDKVIQLLEGTFRSVNNLLERFHQSFFLYFLVESNSYLSIAFYYPALGILLIGLALNSFLCFRKISAAKQITKDAQGLTLTESYNIYRISSFSPFLKAILSILIGWLPLLELTSIDDYAIYTILLVGIFFNRYTDMDDNDKIVYRFIFYSLVMSFFVSVSLINFGWTLGSAFLVLPIIYLGNSDWQKLLLTLIVIYSGNLKLYPIAILYAGT